jgi:hypothetical protein
MFDRHDYLTRLYTTMSPSEMTLDPFFETNKEMEDVSNLHEAKAEYICTENGTDFVLKVTLEDGTVIYYPTGASVPFVAGDNAMPTCSPPRGSIN